MVFCWFGVFFPFFDLSLFLWGFCFFDFEGFCLWVFGVFFKDKLHLQAFRALKRNKSVLKVQLSVVDICGSVCYLK